MAGLERDQLPAPPARGPFALRARVLTPIASGGTRFLPDGVVVADGEGRIADVRPWTEWAAESPAATAASSLVDLRPLLLLPGLVDLHAHLPQLPNAALGAGLHLLTWLERYIYPLERGFDRAAAARLAPAAFARMASLGTTTAVVYGAAWGPSMDEVFRAAAEHGLRLVGGRVMMDRITYRDTAPDRLLDLELRESAELCARWHGHDDGRLAYAYTPRFAISCTAELLRESAALARAAGAYWQTHLSEDRNELEEVGRLFPTARDYLDVYDIAGGLGPRAIMAHAIHLSDREVARMAETRTRIAHCPESNLFLASGAMPLARYRAAGLVAGIGSDVAGGPSLSLFSVMRAGAYVHDLVRVLGEAEGAVLADWPARADRAGTVTPLDWLAIATLEGARALGIEDRIGSLEAGKDADLIAVDPCRTAPLPGLEVDDPEELMSRLIFSPHPEMVLHCDLFHPHQILADLMTMIERLRDLRGRTITVSWAYAASYQKPISVPQDLILAATRFGMNVRLVHPPEFELLPDIVEQARENARRSHGSLELLDDFDAGVRGADVVYAKSWGALLHARDDADAAAIAARYTNWITDERRMALASEDALYMHPLPADRNVEVADAVIDGPHSVVYDEAENRLHAQKAVMALTMG